MNSPKEILDDWSKRINNMTNICEHHAEEISVNSANENTSRDISHGNKSNAGISTLEIIGL